MTDQKEFRIYLLGSPRLLWHEQSLHVSRRQVRALLYRLAASITTVTRQELYALLWAEKSDSMARRNLSRLITYLRQELPDPDLVQVTPETVTLDTERVWCDLPTLLGEDTDGSDEALESVVSLVGGHLLEGFYLPDNLLFEDWFLETQRKVEIKYLDLLDEFVGRRTRVSDYGAAYAGKAYLFAPNLIPIADAGGDQDVKPEDLVKLDGSGSHDPDGDLPMGFHWQQTDGVGVTLSDAAAILPSFTAPTITGTLSFSLVVTDSLGAVSLPDIVHVDVQVNEPDKHLIFLPLTKK